MGKCDSLVVGNLDPEADENFDSYPRIAANDDPDSAVFDSEAWRMARNHEFRLGQFAAAAKLYKNVFPVANGGIGPARAQESMARSLIKAGRTTKAVEALLAQAKSTTLDEGGRSFAANAELRLLQILPDDSPIRADVLDSLTRRLNDYKRPIVSRQRCFLMNEVIKLMSETPHFPTHAAEATAVRYLESTPVTQQQSSDNQLRTTLIDDLWRQASPDQSLTVLWKTETIGRRIGEICEEIPLPKGVRWTTTQTGGESSSLVDVSLGPTLGFWKLGVTTDHDYESVGGSKGRSAIYIWIALLVVATTTVLAWILSGVVRKRLELAEQKNNLVANVSHELKTPLTSIRLLVDTLLMNQQSGGNSTDSSQQQDYLKLIAQENTRLTRLINNFLTFSKLDQGKSNLNLQNTSVSAVANEAIDVFSDRTPEAVSSIQLTVCQDCVIAGDCDALVTVLVNLLENAWKYNLKDEKEIRVCLDQENSQASISVSDNGMGIDTRTQRKIFDRFYQANTLMTREQTGCGLGLSIVKAIVLSHGGSITVESKTERGSKFIILLPSVEVRQEEKQGQGKSDA